MLHYRLFYRNFLLITLFFYWGVLGYDIKSLNARDKIIPCTLKHTKTGAIMSCQALGHPYCKDKEHPKCTYFSKNDNSPSSSCESNDIYNPPGRSAEKILYSYRVIGDSSIVPLEPTEDGYIPIGINKPLKWSTSFRYDNGYEITKPSQYIQNAPFEGDCESSSGCSQATQSNGCIVRGGSNARNCTVSRSKIEFEIPSDQNIGPLIFRTRINIEDSYGPIKEDGTVGGPVPLPLSSRDNQVEGVFGLRDDGNPEITIEGIDVNHLFTTDSGLWCNIDTYSKSQANNYTPSIGCSKYASGANVTQYGEDLFKNMKIVVSDTSGVSELRIYLGKCKYEPPENTTGYHSCENGGNKTIKRRVLDYDTLKSHFGLSKSDRIDTGCLVPGKNRLLIATLDDARSGYDGISYDPNASILSVPGYIQIDNTTPKIGLFGDFDTALFEGSSNGNSFTGCFINATGNTVGLQDRRKWINYSVLGNIKIADPYGAAVDNCHTCYSKGEKRTCDPRNSGKPIGEDTHSIWVSPLGVHPKTGVYSTISCGGTDLPIHDECAWGCESGYSRYTKSNGRDACGISAICGKAHRTESYTTPSGEGLCLQGTPNSLIRTGSGWSWSCESKDGNILIDKTSCISFFPGQAKCNGDTCSPGGQPSCSITFSDRFGSGLFTENTTDKSIGHSVSMSWNTQNMSSFRYSCSGLQVGGKMGKWEGEMQAGAGIVPTVTIRDNVDCAFSDVSTGKKICTFKNTNIIIPTNYGVCGEFAGGALFQDIPRPNTGTLSPSGYCQTGSVIDFTNLAHMGSGSLHFTDEIIKSTAESAYQTLINAGNRLVNGPFIWGCKLNNTQVCTAGACGNGMTYNNLTGQCDGECSEGTISIIGDDGQKECISCDPFPGYEPYINQYLPGKFACYYYSSELKFPYGYWHGTGGLWKDYSSLMSILRSLERPKDLVEGNDIKEYVSGSSWNLDKFNTKNQFIVGTGIAIGSGTTGFALDELENYQDITYNSTTFPRPCFDRNNKLVDPADVWIIEDKKGGNVCYLRPEGIASITNLDELLPNSPLETRSSCNIEIPEGYTGAYIEINSDKLLLSSIAKPNSKKNTIEFTELNESVSITDFSTTPAREATITKNTKKYSVGGEETIAIQFSRNCSSFSGCQPSGNGNRSFDANFIEKYIDVPVDGSTCYEERKEKDFTTLTSAWCLAQGRSLSRCYKVMGYDQYGQEIRMNLNWKDGINKQYGPLLFTSIYPYYGPEFDESNIVTMFMNGVQPLFYIGDGMGSSACWLVYENTYRKDNIGIIHFSPTFAHNNMIHPYAYISYDRDGNELIPREQFRKTMEDHPDAITFGLAENGTCSTISAGHGGFNAPKKKKPRISRIQPDPGLPVNPPIKMCTVWSTKLWAYIQEPCK